jgi:hypothetical protein
MLTLHEPNGSTRMSEIMEPYSGQTGTLESRFEASVHEVTGVRRRARRRGENVLRVLYYPSFVGTPTAPARAPITGGTQAMYNRDTSFVDPSPGQREGLLML